MSTVILESYNHMYEVAKITSGLRWSLNATTGVKFLAVFALNTGNLDTR